MIEAIEKGINPVLIQNNMPELKVKVGIDEGEDLIIQYGHDTTSLIDILGYTMNRTAKITFTISTQWHYHRTECIC